MGVNFLVFVWTVRSNGQRSLESECLTWERAFSFVPNWGTLKVVADWQGIHLIHFRSVVEKGGR